MCHLTKHLLAKVKKRRLSAHQFDLFPSIEEPETASWRELGICLRPHLDLE